MQQSILKNFKKMLIFDIFLSNFPIGNLQQVQVWQMKVKRNKKTLPK